MATLKATPFEQIHIDLGARMVPFGGWNMPVQYEGIIAEHNHTRSQVSLFDCSHMGQFRLQGEEAAADLDHILPRKASDQPIGSCRYNFLLNESGGIIDDLIVYRESESSFFIVVNAGTCENDANWMKAHSKASFTDISTQTAKLDLQGPEVMRCMAELGLDEDSLPAYFKFTNVVIDGVPVLLSRTGYTGERGFEFYFPAEDAEKMWTRLSELPNVKPAGLGARDTLRLEMAYPLYGHELDEETTPLEAGFKRMLDLEDHDFIGADALRKDPARKLVGLEFEGRRAAREGADVLKDGESIGTVCSGSFSPSLGKAIALAYIKSDAAKRGDEIEASAGKTTIGGSIVKLPFYKEGSARS